jgi:hypothetical protein
MEEGNLSVILSTEDKEQKMPLSWILSPSYTVEKTKNGGFSVNRNKDNNQEFFSLNPTSGRATIKNYNQTSFLSCKRIGSWKAPFETIKSGPPLEYINGRLSGISYLRKKVGSYDFNSILVAGSSKGEDYQSVYSLLSPLSTENLTMEQKDLIESAKQKMIDSDTLSSSIWEWNGGLRVHSDAPFLDPSDPSLFGIEYHYHTCRRISESPQRDGFTILNSTPQEKISAKGVTCYGTLHLIKKQGSLRPQSSAELFATID